MGLKELNGRDRQHARAGNSQLRSAIKMVSSSMAAGKQGYLEQPRGSLMWHVSRWRFRRVLASGLARIVHVGLCMHGTH